jgi:hypothetical protein
MKIKLIGLTEKDKDNGLKSGDIFEVTKVEIEGDYCAYDIWYYIKFNGKQYVFSDFQIEVVEEDERFSKLEENINKTTFADYKDMPFKFKYEIDVEIEFEN